MKADWCIVVIVILELGCFASGLRWLSLATLGSVDHLEKQEACDTLTGLVKRQKKICKRNIEVMAAIQKGAVKAIDECQYQFENRRWNCSTVDHGSAVFGNVLNAGTREAAFVHAISSAGVAHAVTKACSSGQVDKCGCDRTVKGSSPQGFEWAGCSDNIQYGSAFCEIFVDARERAKGRDPTRALMNLHNNEAGRIAVEEHMRVQCKCHGVSGSCEMKTCWRALPAFREVGAMLKDRFDGASEVQQQKVGSRKKLVPRNMQFKPHTKEDLVYLEASPDYCLSDPETGSLGTSGRACNKSSKAIDGCELMCCGRGYQVRRRIVDERCHCKFHWCCHVKCQQCKKVVDEYICR